MNIFLIGYRCTGKTSVGKALAGKLTRPFIDADEELVKKNRVTISDMVAEHGWEFFREKERAVIKSLCSLENHVIATGGGAVLNPDNVKDMKETGLVIWLKASAETIHSRIIQDIKTLEQRPALTHKNLMEEIKETLELRNPLYQYAADFAIDTDLSDTDEICNRIKERL
ncbi:Shikimate kinase [Desulfonema limicola]|uniref:Shikimate kinase n=1 Tax=Desulfonema limicola TaxID=45656 RepID=A0A975B9R9_9BACT|nr:shikimate kinase [Desulfonema limicola]QTA81483.1 Shikimate kinase [Desulfonema limicola]